MRRYSPQILAGGLGQSLSKLTPFEDAYILEASYERLNAQPYSANHIHADTSKRYFFTENGTQDNDLSVSYLCELEENTHTTSHAE
jgi:hypothetical protein